MNLHNLIEKYRKASELDRFLVKGASIYIIWRIIRKYMIVWGQYEDFTNSFSKIYLTISEFFLSIMGFETYADYEEKKLWINGSLESVEIVYDCLGINLFFIFTIFILAFKSRILTKLWYIPAGLTIIFLLNAIRISCLTYIVFAHPENVDLFHHFIFQGIIYMCIFLMWYAFVKLTAKQKTASV